MSDESLDKRQVSIAARSGSRIPSSVLRDGIPVLMRLAQEGRGTAEALLEESRAPENPFHGLMRWDEADQQLARQYRLGIARVIWGSVEVRYTGSDGSKGSTRAFTAVRVDGARRYMPTPEVVRNPSLQHQILEQVKADIASLKRKHSMLKQLFSRGEIVELFEEHFFSE